MAIKSGQFLHDANGFVVDRIQSGGASGLNIPEEKIRELGNYNAVATVRDTPDLSFDVESYDMTTEVEAILTGQDPTDTDPGDEFDFINAMPVDIISPFKADGAYNIVKGIAIPYLTLESATYRFGVGENATQSFTLRGDSIYYIPGTPRYTEVALVGGTATYALGGTALPYNESGQTRYVLCATVKNATTHEYRRLSRGADYSDTTTNITLTNDDWVADGYTTLHIVWGTATEGEYPQTVHPSAAVKPAAIRAKDIDVYIQTSEATPTLVRWTSVQSFDLTRTVTLENDSEFGNPNFVDQSYDEPEVSGSITIKPRDLDDLWAKMRQIANVPDGEIIGPLSSVPLGIEIRVTNPDDGSRLKTFFIDDARFTLPSISGAVETRQEVTFDWTSDGGRLKIYDGERP